MDYIPYSGDLNPLYLLWVLAPIALIIGLGFRLQWKKSIIEKSVTGLLLAAVAGFLVILFVSVNSYMAWEKEVATSLAARYDIYVSKYDVQELEYPTWAPPGKSYYGTTIFSTGPAPDAFGPVTLGIIDGKALLFVKSGTIYEELASAKQ